MSLPKIQEFLLETELYKKININHDNYLWLDKLINSGIQLDAYCPHCKKLSTFHSKKERQIVGSAFPGPEGTKTTPKQRYRDLKKENNEFVRVLECSRNRKHVMAYYFLILENRDSDDKILKIGQYPSLADLKKPNIDKYYKILLKLLSDEKANEFNDAIILYANGFSIGAFVHLRRIFESLIEKNYLENKENLTITKENFIKNNSMKEKISILKSYLPEFIVKNKHLYGILSKGIHQLSKNECSEIFNIVRTSIEIILDDIHKKEEEQKKRKKIKKELNDINMKYN
jgi:hypothetical protein